MVRFLSKTFLFFSSLTLFSVHVDEVQLGQLDLFRQEIKYLSAGVALSTARLLDNQHDSSAAALLAVVYYVS